MCVLGMAEEFRGEVAVNALWPKTGDFFFFCILSSTACLLDFGYTSDFFWNWFRRLSSSFAYSLFTLRTCWFSFLVLTRLLPLWSKLIFSQFATHSILLPGWSICVVSGLSVLVLMHPEFWFGQSHKSVSMLSLVSIKCLCMYYSAEYFAS